MTMTKGRQRMRFRDGTETPCDRFVVLIPALNEEQSLPLVLDALRQVTAATVIVIDNGSTDQTAERAIAAGAIVVREEVRGYGRAMLRGLSLLDAVAPRAETVVFLDGDFSDDPTKLPDLVAPIIAGTAQFVLGSRVMGPREPGAMPWHSLNGNRFACWLMNRMTGAAYTDLGPFRAIRRDVLDQLGMSDPDYGWTIEMQLKAAAAGVSWLEIPIPYRRRVGVSKISGTVVGSIRAGMKILGKVALHAAAARRLPATRDTNQRPAASSS